MQSKVFFCKETFKNITEKDRLDAKRFESEGDMYLPFEKKFGFFIKTIQLEIKAEVIKLDGNIHNNFTLYVVRHFSSWGQTKADKDFIKEFYTIKEFSYSCTDGLIGGSCSKQIILDKIFYEIHDKYVQKVLKKKDFNKRDIEPLAHYTKMETAIEDILPKKKNRLLLKELCKTNDPVESKKSFNEFIALDENQDLILEYLNKKEKGFLLKKDFERMVKSISFSEDSTRKAYALPTMWAHYGQNHKGVCLVFDQTILKRLFWTKFKSKVKPDKINYGTLELPKLTKEVSVNSEEFFLKHAADLFFKKDSDWESESEYRFVVVNPKKDKDVDDGKCYLAGIDQALIAIILTEDFVEYYLPAVEKLWRELTNTDYGIYKLAFDDGELKLVVRNNINLFDYYIVEG